MEHKVRYVFLFLGVLSLVLSVFDFALEHDYFGGLLAVAWGFLFIFLAFKRLLEVRYTQEAARIVQVILILFVIIAGLSKTLFKLRALKLWPFD
jgi:amino acid transporter